MADVIFGTSGSTGASKRIVRTEDSLRADAAMLVASFPELWASRPTVVATIRPEHMYGALWRVRAPEAAGSAVDPAVVLSVEELTDRVRSAGNVLFVTTPSFLEKALHHPDFAALKGRFAGIVTSGSLLRAETSRAVAETLGTCPFEIYGSTETGSVAWRRQTDGEAWTLCPGVGASLNADGALVVDSPWAMTRPFVLSDGARFLDDRRFVLLGRLDRRVKVLETFVSLPAVESVLESHPFVSRARVETCGGDVVRLGALVVLSPEGAKALAAGTCAAVAARLRQDLRASVGDAAFPRRLRFVRELPHNEQGKTTAAAVREVLSAWCAEPATLAWEESAGTLTARFAFPSDLTCFKGHFPSFAILPGVAQMYFVRHFARQAFPDYPDACVFRRLKFQKIVVPNAEVTLTVTRQGPGSFSFALVGSTGPCASGLVERISE